MVEMKIVSHDWWLWNYELLNIYFHYTSKYCTSTCTVIYIYNHLTTVWQCWQSALWPIFCSGKCGQKTPQNMCINVCSIYSKMFNFIHGWLFYISRTTSLCSKPDKMVVFERVSILSWVVCFIMVSCHYLGGLRQ